MARKKPSPASQAARAAVDALLDFKGFRWWWSELDDAEEREVMACLRRALRPFVREAE
jgi:hypothetical protein